MTADAESFLSNTLFKVCSNSNILRWHKLKTINIFNFKTNDFITYLGTYYAHLKTNVIELFTAVSYEFS
jgi:hypothetical protein